jgi:hypothetical protein
LSEPPAGRVVHADFFRLGDANPDALARVTEAASELRALPGVQSVLAIEASGPSDYDLAVFFLLDGLAALEAFGTDQRYTAFLQKVVAPLIAGLAGADVRIEGALNPASDTAACMGLMAPPTAYDWEVRAALEAWASSGARGSIIGLAVGGGQRFRGLALQAAPEGHEATRPEVKGFGVSYVQGRLRVLS